MNQGRLPKPPPKLLMGYRLLGLFLAISMVVSSPSQPTHPRQEAVQLMDQVTGQILSAFDQHLATTSQKYHRVVAQLNEAEQTQLLLQHRLQAKQDIITLAQVRLTQQRRLLEQQNHQLKTLNQQLLEAQAWANQWEYTWYPECLAKLETPVVRN